jgi:hypothetical protein
MFQARVTSADQVFLEAYKALCVEHGRQIDISGPEWDVEISAYAGDTTPILFLPFLEAVPADSDSARWAILSETPSQVGVNTYLAKKLKEQASRPSRFMHFVDPETNTVEKVALKHMPPFVVPKE